MAIRARGKATVLLIMCCDDTASKASYKDCDHNAHNQISLQRGPPPVAIDLIRWMASTSYPRETLDLIVG
ncbi:hypothetical protein PG993_002877 [Apiospora rasikravindrae]|uniref:Uncharacterized protein n=1 Tax=Apiospora rasikravindrae TaxID=990691 RepID=A0ABR1TXY9_9PEZI